MTGGKRHVLIADDESVNRELLGFILKDEYDVLFASDGIEALDSIEKNAVILNLILLDLQMPGMHGLDILRRMREDQLLQHIPVIVMTSDQSAEVECLRLGATDFIPKPFSQPDVILARVQRVIELYEDRETIRSTERDSLTGLLNIDYFYRYSKQFDLHHADVRTDAILLDVNHFHVINERYGKSFGDDVLSRIGKKLSDFSARVGGLACRRESDNFLLYCPHLDNFEGLLSEISVSIGAEGDSITSRARIRMGVHISDDKTIDIDQRFDRAKLASDSIRNNFTKLIAVYDDAMHEAELYNEQLIDDFQEAIAQKQFKVFYQPKFDIRSDVPVLSSAEALVRWEHPRLGMISPGRFIPLFEENGLIRQLDHYVWSETAAQISDWKKRFGASVAVSVNVSRIDMLDSDLTRTLQDILAENSVTTRDFLLEITESAYTSDSAQIIGTVKKLREMGFRIEMDDFGTGYSSLGMISNLPIDALKLDMTFIRNAFSENKDMWMIELIIDIADHLGVPVIAEGVETEEQLTALKNMGCDMVQGYYFSKPVPAPQFERFILEKLESEKERGSLSNDKRSSENGETVSASDGITYSRIARALAADYFSVYYVNTVTDKFIEYNSTGTYKKLNIETSGEDFWEACAKNISRVVYSEDRDMLLKAISKQNLLSELSKSGTFTLTYRLIVNDNPTFVSMKASRIDDKNSSHIVIAVNNVDAQMKRQVFFGGSSEMAQRDALTGVKNRFAFLERKKAINSAIEDGAQQPFAVVVCDMNGLKSINDTKGHLAGDKSIQAASSTICNVFKHSPVFRIGGDEFVILMSGQDYENRKALVSEIEESNRSAVSSGGVIIACGISDYLPGSDASVDVIFDRADAAMYENKKALKSFAE